MAFTHNYLGHSKVTDPRPSWERNHLLSVLASLRLACPECIHAMWHMKQHFTDERLTSSVLSFSLSRLLTYALLSCGHHHSLTTVYCGIMLSHLRCAITNPLSSMLFWFQMEKAKQRREKVNDWESRFVALLFLDVLPDMNHTLLLLLISAQMV